jgi:hypothetical protein
VRPRCAALLVALLAAGAPAGAWQVEAPRQPTSLEGLRVESHEAAESDQVQVRAWLDQTALWPGDRVRYALEITCAPGIDVLADDLSGDKLALSGLELLSSERERRVSGDGVTTYRVRHELTAYELGTPLLIQEQVLRYFVRRPGQRVEDAAPAGEARVPGVSLALRSTLPDELAEARLRDETGPAPLPALLTWGRLLGLALVLLCGLPVALWAIPLLRRAWARRSARGPGVASADLRAELEELEGVDAASESARRLGYEKLDALLRRRLGDVGGVDASALTAAEVGARLADRPDRIPDALAAVLEECERARYAPAEALPSAERFAAGLATARELLGAR